MLGVKELLGLDRGRLEERFLVEKFSTIYLDWADRTPVFIPNFKRWRAPTKPFQIKTVLKREYNGLLAVATAYLTIEMIVDLLMEGEVLRAWLVEDILPIAFFGFSAICFLVLRTLKKNTSVLG